MQLHTIMGFHSCSCNPCGCKRAERKAELTQTAAKKAEMTQTAARKAERKAEVTKMAARKDEMTQTVLDHNLVQYLHEWSQFHQVSFYHTSFEGWI
jgi:hypothetical protein